MKTKTFDCIEMKRKAAGRIHEEIGNLTLDQKIAYWRERSEKFRAEQETLTPSESGAVPPTQSRREDPS